MFTRSRYLPAGCDPNTVIFSGRVAQKFRDKDALLSDYDHNLQFSGTLSLYLPLSIILWRTSFKKGQTSRI